MMTIEKPYLTVKDVAQRLDVTERTVRYWIVERKELRAVYINGWRIYPEDLDDFIARRTSEPIRNEGQDDTVPEDKD